MPFPEEILFEGRPVGGGGGGSRIWDVVGTLGLDPGIGGTRLDLLAVFIVLTGDVGDSSLEPIFGFRELYSVVGDCGT